MGYTVEFAGLRNVHMKNRNWLFYQRVAIRKSGSGRGARTPDQWIMIPLLYQLSYAATLFSEALENTRNEISCQAF